MLISLKYDKKINKRAKSYCFINQAGKKIRKHQEVLAEFTEKLVYDGRPN